MTTVVVGRPVLAGENIDVTQLQSAQGNNTIQFADVPRRRQYIGQNCWETFANSKIFPFILFVVLTFFIIVGLMLAGVF